ncbi:MAG: hypothetical protein ILM98_13935 [Kiritimatiellae bacterium]|nr:hypothetical protein [Kiritimatiellia bacterium]
MGSILGGFFKRFRKGDSLHKAVTKDNLDKLFNILEDIQGVNCRIEKPTDAEGKGWRIVIDGSSDELPPGDTTTPWEMEADHWGAAKPLTELPADADGSWEARKNPTEVETASAVAESSLIELELDEEGRVSAKRYRTRTFDTHGNLIAISDRTESATPDPGGEEEPDPCGNPLNEGSEATDDDWDNPLEGGGEAGDEEDEEESPKEWDNPLDHEGDGGFTPPCRKN